MKDFGGSVSEQLAELTVKWWKLITDTRWSDLCENVGPLSGLICQICPIMIFNLVAFNKSEFCLSQLKITRYITCHNKSIRWAFPKPLLLYTVLYTKFISFLM